MYPNSNKQNIAQQNIPSQNIIQQICHCKQSTLKVKKLQQVCYSEKLDRRSIFQGTVAGGLIIVDRAIAGSEDRFEDSFITVNNLSAFQKTDIKNDLKQRAQKELLKVFKPEDSNKLQKLVFNNAATWDWKTQTGGMTGSIAITGEIDRPENRDLKDYVSRMKVAKDAIDQQNAKNKGQQPISWADLIVLAAKVTTEAEWRKIKIGKAETAEGGEFIAAAFGANWQLTIGRQDSTTPSPEGRLPKENATPDEIKDFFLRLDNSNYPPPTYPFAPKAPFYERAAYILYPAIKDNPKQYENFLAQTDEQFKNYDKKYGISRQTISRTDYEVDFLTQFNKLTLLGAKIDPDAYLFPIPIKVPKKGQLI